MGTFFVMECDGQAPIGRVDLVSVVEESPWMDGTMVPPPEGPVLFRAHSRRRGNLKAMYELSALLVREDLLQAILDSGVDNLQVFEAIVQDPTGGVDHINYRACNVIGVVAAADMQRSVLMHDETVTGLDHDFAELVLDEARIPADVLLFRLAESTSAIVVHQRVREEIEARGIEGMIFYEPGEWSG